MQTRIALTLFLCVTALTSFGAVDPLSPDFLKDHLSELSGAKPFQLGEELVTLFDRQSEENKKLARQWLAEKYRALGFTVSFHPYQEGFYSGVNFVAERKGAQADRFYLIASHYDTVRTAGADDDGSGTISALAVAESLGKAPLTYGVRIVAFDQEEVGLVGSRAYAAELRKDAEIDSMQGLFMLEMTAYHVEDGKTQSPFHVIDCKSDPERPEGDSAELSKAILDAVSREKIALTRVPACTGRSDHESFWNEGRPAIVISENFFGGEPNPCYHKRCDTVDKLNFEYMSRITRAVASAMDATLRR